MVLADVWSLTLIGFISARLLFCPSDWRVETARQAFTSSGRESFLFHFFISNGVQFITNNKRQHMNSQSIKQHKRWRLATAKRSRVSMGDLVRTLLPSSWSPCKRFIRTNAENKQKRIIQIYTYSNYTSSAIYHGYKIVSDRQCLT